jgi:hypothetical protein
MAVRVTTVPEAYEAALGDLATEPPAVGEVVVVRVYVVVEEMAVGYPYHGLVQPVLPLIYHTVNPNAQDANTSVPITGALPKKCAAVRFVQFPNALAPILVTPLPMVTLVSPVQPWNALLPILVTLSGMVRPVSPEQPRNA